MRAPGIDAMMDATYNINLFNQQNSLSENDQVANHRRREKIAGRSWRYQATGSDPKKYGESHESQA